jgi:hypothetical protein
MESLVQGEKKIWMTAITARDEFAKAALTGLVGHPKNREDFELLADMAFQIADAMMKRRQQESP